MRTGRRPMPQPALHGNRTETSAVDDAMTATGILNVTPHDSVAEPVRRHSTAPPIFDRIYLALILSLIVAMPFLVHDQTEGRPLAASLNPLKFLEHQTTAGNAHKQLMLALLYLSCGAVLVLRNSLGRLRYIGLPLGAMMLWTIASTLWSVDPTLTLRRCAAIDGVALVGIYAGLRFRFTEMLRVMAWVTAIGLLASLAVAIVLPTYGLDYDGRLRGVLDHKNALGGFAALSLLLVLCRLSLSPAIDKLQALDEGALGGVAVFCLLLAHSATPVAVLAVAVLTLIATRVLRNAHPTVLALSPLLAGAILIGIAVLVFKLSYVAPVFGRNAELSGRTLIWHFALQMAWARPLAGYGYGAFWAGENSPGSVFWYLTHVAATHAHNGYLQAWLDVGVIGLSLLVSAVVLTLYKLAWLLRYVREPFVPWAFAYLAFICATNVTESTLWAVNSLQTALLAYVIVRTNILSGGARDMLAATSAPLPGGMPMVPMAPAVARPPVFGMPQPAGKPIAVSSGMRAQPGFGIGGLVR